MPSLRTSSLEPFKLPRDFSHTDKASRESIPDDASKALMLRE